MAAYVSGQPLKRGVALLLFAAVVSSGCSAERVAPGAVTVTESDSSGVRVVAISGDPQSLPTWRLGATPLFEISGNVEPFLSTVGEVEFLSDGSLLVEDNQTDVLRLFDSRGNFIRVIGGQGEGPGEFQNLTGLSVAGDTIYAYDRRLYRVSVFLTDGTLLRSTQLTRQDEYGDLGLDAWAIDSAHLYLRRATPYVPDPSIPLPRRVTQNVVLLPLDSTGQVRGTPTEFAGGYSAEFEDGFVAAPFSNQPVIQTSDQELVYAAGESFDFWWTDRDLGIRRIVRWPEWDVELSEVEVAELRDSVFVAMTEFREQRPDIAAQLMEARFADHMLPDMRPAVGGIFIADDGMWWVSRFQPSLFEWRQESVWHVLSAEDRPLARVSLPPRSKLAAVSSDLVAVINVDALDVQHVRVFEILRDSGGAS